MTRHIEIIAVLQAGWACFQLLIAGLMGLLFMGLGGGLGALGAGSGEDELLLMGVAYGVIGGFVAVMSAVMSIPGFLAAYGIYTRKSWGRILGMIMAGLACLSVPMGTMIGVYSLFVLLDAEVSNEFAEAN